MEIEILDLIGRHCPRSLNTYLMCLGHSNEEGKSIFSKQQIAQDLSESFAKFRNDLKALAREGLLEWHEMGGYLHIHLVKSNEL